MTTLTRTSILPLLLTGFVSVSAQTTAPVHHAATTTTAHKPATAAPGGCATDVPVLSPKIPALPAGTPCPKAMFTFTSTPTVKLSYVSPLVTPEVREALGLEPTSFSLAYSEVKAGAGELALPHKFYTVNYTGYLIDGTKFDSSIDAGKPFSFAIGAHQVIPGWDLGLQGMHMGGKRRLYIPWELAYGDRGKPPQIPAKAELIFDIELISQSDEDPRAKTPPAPKPAPATPPATTPSTPPAAAPAPAAKPATPPPTQSTTPNPKPATPQQ
jgi:peptidylprolyl isomerase